MSYISSIQQCSDIVQEQGRGTVRKRSSFHKRQCPKDSCHGSKDFTVSQAVDDGVEHGGKHSVEDSQNLIFCGGTETPRSKISVGKRGIIKCHHS